MKLDRHISRRGVVKGSAAAGAVALFAPAYVKNALSSSGELNVMFWSDELPEDLLKSFSDKTGIKVNFTGFGSNEELLNKIVDVVPPPHPLPKLFGALMRVATRRDPTLLVASGGTIGVTTLGMFGHSSGWPRTSRRFIPTTDQPQRGQQQFWPRTGAI